MGGRVGFVFVPFRVNLYHSGSIIRHLGPILCLFVVILYIPRSDMLLQIEIWDGG